MRFGWCVSGRGMAARAIVAARLAGLTGCNMCVIISDRPSIIEQFCSTEAIPYVLSSGPLLSEDLKKNLALYDLDWLGLTFNRLIAADVIEDFKGRIMNLHMSLLPLFPGFGATRLALGSGMRVAGATLHLVDEQPDNGEIIGQVVCPIYPDDTLVTLGKRQFEAALPLLLQIVRLLETGRLSVHNGKLRWNPLELIKGKTFPLIDEDIAMFAADFCSSIEPALAGDAQIVPKFSGLG